MRPTVAPTAARRSTASRIRFSRAFVRAMLSRIRRGLVVLVDDSGVDVYGDPDADLAAVVTVRDPQAYVELVPGGSIGLGEAYFRGHYDVDDLAAFLRILTRNTETYDRAEYRWSRAIDPLRTRLERVGRRARERERADRDTDNVRAHYDLGDEFFELFLDETMMYSCAIFDAPEADLAAAQREKLDRICRKLDLRTGDRLVEIGSGWGGLAVHAADVYGAEVTTTTISARQHRYVQKRIHDAGVADRVHVLDRHYRDVDGTYDKLVSIEMIEAVDWRDYDEYFGTCARLLRPGGTMVLQAITIPDNRFEQRKRREDFVKRYIFPGGCIPSLTEIGRASAAAGLDVVSVDDIGHHYGPTLDAWRRRLRATTDDARRHGFDDEFLRLWEFYLAMCEAGFRERHVGDVQAVLRRREV